MATGRSVLDAGGIAIKRIKTDGRVIGTGREAEERILALSRVLVWIASVGWWAHRSGRRRKRKPSEGESDEKGRAQRRAVH